MPTQPVLCFDAVPVTCEVQHRYHAIAPCLAGTKTPVEQARALNLADSTITRWLRDFRKNGMPGLFPASQYPREPYTPERVIVQLLFFKCCAPKAGDRELARVIHHLTGHQIHHQTVKALCERFFFWRSSEFQRLVHYPIPANPQALRLEMVSLSTQGWACQIDLIILRAFSFTGGLTVTNALLRFPYTILNRIPMAAKIIKLAKKHEHQWVALTHPDNKIVGSGKDARTALAAAEQKGDEEAFLLKVPPLNSYYVGAL